MTCTRRESLGRLGRLARIALVAPFGVAAAACIADPEPDLSVDQSELAAAGERASGEPGDVKDVVLVKDGVQMDEQAARQHFAAMKDCLRQQGIAPPEGKRFRILLHKPGTGTGEPGEPKVRFMMRAGSPDEAAQPGEPHVVALDEKTSAALKACADRLDDQGARSGAH